MSNVVYPLALEAFGRGQIIWPTDTIMVQLLGAGYAYASYHRSPNDLTDQIGAPALVVANKYVTGGEFYGGPMTLPSIAAGSTVRGIAFWQDVGVMDDSRLIAFIDTRSDSAAINFPTDGSDVTVSWPSSLIFRI